MTNPVVDLLSDGLASPLGEVIAAVGRGVAEAQAALDAASLKATLDIYGEDGDPGTALLREIGYQPTFYVLPETTCEVQVSMRIGGTGGPDGSAGGTAINGAVGRARTYVTPVDAGFQQRYGFQAQAAAKLTFKIVPVPPLLALDSMRPVPALIGQTVATASTRLAGIGLQVALIDASGRTVDAATAAASAVTAQDAPPNSLRAIGDVVTLTIPAK